MPAITKNDTRESNTGEKTRSREEARFRAFADASGRNRAKAGEREPFARRGHETVRGRRATLSRLPETLGTSRGQSGNSAEEGWRRIGRGAVRSRSRGKTLARRRDRANPPPDESPRIFRRGPNRCRCRIGTANAGRRRAAPVDSPRHALQRASGPKTPSTYPAPRIRADFLCRGTPSSALAWRPRAL